ncbi:MAG: YkoF family thiamine/hydroxymethylpyrimidine-binding protein [Saprospiraceae bacterium]
MRISVEISKYPLTPDYGNPILSFIERLKSYPELVVRSNTMSTQIFGEYEEVHSILQKEMKASFESPETVVMVMKFVNQDLLD